MIQEGSSYWLKANNVVVSKSVAETRKGTFKDCDSTTIRSFKFSYSERYARDNKINFEPIE